MSDVQKTFAVNTAIEARKSCEEQNIIEMDKIKLTLEDINNIIEFFGGQLLESNNNVQYFEKTGEEAFIVYYLPQDNEKDKASSVLALLNGFGKSFFQLESMDIGEIRVYSENGLATTEGESYNDSQMANYFAMEFMMPRKLFEKVSIENRKDNKVDCRKVAEEFGIDYMDVIKRGAELDIFNLGPSYTKKYS